MGPRVFISYAQYEPAHSDRVLALAHALAADGLDVELDQFHAHELIDWPRWCAECLDPQNTDFVLLVCSAEYRRRIEGRVDRDVGRGVFWEGNLIYGYLYRAKANERFVPLLLDEEPESSLPPIVANWNRFRLRGFGTRSRDPGYENLYRLLTGQPAMPKPAPGEIVRLPPRPLPSATASPAPATKTAKPINLPYPSLGALFKGREDLLAELRTGFAGEPARPQLIVARHAIHGLGGIGKTRAAVEYAWRHADDYSALLFVTAQSPADLRTKLAALCDLLGIALGVTEEAERVRAALGWLADPGNAGWLLIVDNVDTIEAAEAVEQLLASLTGGHLLITGCLSDWPGDIQARRLDVLDAEAAQQFLEERTAGRRRTDPDDAEEALALARELGYLALALEQAAAFIRRHSLTFADYRRRWQAAERKVIEWHDPRTMQYERPLAVTWQATVEALPPGARSLLDLLAWLAPELLPRFLFDHAAAPVGLEHLFEDREEPREILAQLSGEPDADPEEALAALRDYSLLQPAEESELASEGQVHRVLALITRERQPAGKGGGPALRAALALVDAAAVGDPQDVRSWPLLEALAPHMDTVAEHAEGVGMAAPTARLLNQLGLLLKTKAEHAKAEPLYRRALAINEASFGPEHPNISFILNNLAGLLQDTNRQGEAEPLLRRALAIAETSYGPKHPNVAIALNNLAQLLKSTNRWKDAEPLMRRALRIDEASYGLEHPTVAIRLNNLATLLQATHRLGEAEPLLRRALTIDETRYGPDHPSVANALANLAQLLQATDRRGDAEPLMRQALAIDEASYGPEHPKVAIHLNNLARLLHATHRLGESEPFMRRHLLIFLAFTRNSRHPHPHLSAAFRNYWELLQAMDLSEAERRRRMVSVGPEAGLSAEAFRQLLEGL